MPLFGSGVSWGRRRRKVSATGAQLQRIRRTPSDAGSVTSVACGCGGASKKKDKRRKPGRKPVSPSDYGGVFMGTENNNKPTPDPAQSQVDTSIVYFDDSLLAEQDIPAYQQEPGTPYERTPEPNTSLKATHYSASPKESSGVYRSPKEKKGIFIPPWIRNRRYLPSIDDVDFDQIDSISLHSYRSSPTQMTRDSPHLTMSPIYQNLIDKKVSDVYLNAQMKGLIYSSTPVAVNIVNVAPPRVMTATSEAAAPKGHENRLGSISEVLADLHDPRTPLAQLSFNEPFDQQQSNRQRKNVSPQKDINVSIYENVQHDEKENTPFPLQGERTKAQRLRPSFKRRNFHNDLRRKALTRNFSYKPIREQDIDEIFVNRATPRSSEIHTDSGVLSLKVNMQSDISSSAPYCHKNTLTSMDLLQDFDKLQLETKSGDREPLSSSSSSGAVESSSLNPLSSGSNSETSEYDNVIQKPRFADNSARQARVVNLSSSPESDVSSSTSSSSEDDDFTIYKNAVSFASFVKHPKPPMQRRKPRSKSTINIQNVESHLAKAHKNKIGGKSVQQVKEVSFHTNVLQTDHEMQANYQKTSLLPSYERNCHPHKANKRLTRRRRESVNNERYQTLVETYVIIKDHIPKETDECNVHVGDIVFVNSKNQRDEQIDWMWVMVAETGNLGYIPAFSARPVELQSSSV